MPDLLSTKAAIRKVLGYLKINLTDTGLTAERTYTFPDSNGMLLTKTTSNTIEFGTLGASNGVYARSGLFIIQNPGLTASYLFTASALAANRVVTLPLLTAADQFTFDNHATTLKNKTYSGFKQLDAAKTGAYTLTVDDSIIRADASASAFSLTLPAVAGNTGLTYSIIRTDVENSTNALTIDPNGSELINGNLSYTLWPCESIIIECTGTEWEVITQPQPSALGYYYRKGASTNARYVAGLNVQSIALITSTTGPVVNTLYAMPFIVSRTTKFDTISAEITTGGAGSNIRLGIYQDDGRCYPGVLIFDSGNISAATTGVKDSTITASVQVFNPGLYWLTYENSATVPLVRALPGSDYLALVPPSLGTAIPAYAWSVAHTVGTLPNPYSAGGAARTAVSAVGSPIPAVGLRAI